MYWVHALSAVLFYFSLGEKTKFSPVKLKSPMPEVCQVAVCNRECFLLPVGGGGGVTRHFTVVVIGLHCCLYMPVYTRIFMCAYLHACMFTFAFLSANMLYVPGNSMQACGLLCHHRSVSWRDLSRRWWKCTGSRRSFWTACTAS